VTAGITVATTHRIHPAIGIARVGISPDQFFVGPERLWERPSPSDSVKDDECRVKRQAARFRIFAQHDDGTSSEITATDADITWSVHLVNAKAAHPGRGNSEPPGDLTIDAGVRTLSGAERSPAFQHRHDLVQRSRGRSGAARRDPHGRRRTPARARWDGHVVMQWLIGGVAVEGLDAPVDVPRIGVAVRDGAPRRAPDLSRQW
jgi:hypothetical protein